MKKFISLVLICIAIITSFTMAFADTELLTNNSIVISELELISELRTKSDFELEELGLSKDDISIIKSDYAEKELLRRSKLPIDEMKGLGYSDEQISLLKKYDGSELTKGSVYLALSSTCLGSFSSGTCSGSNIRVRYNWNWTSAPFFNMTDKIAFRWQAVKPNGSYADATVTYSKALAKYYRVTTGVYDSSKDTYYSASLNNIDKTAIFNIPMIKDDNYWAKSGTVYMYFYADGNFTFNYINVGAAYGHKILSGSITVSFPVSTNSWFSFSPSSRVTQETDSSGRVYSNGNVNNYS